LSTPPPSPPQVACTVDISIGVVRALQLEAVVDVRINILDVNDNAPTFTQPQYDVRMSETSKPGFSVPLPVARDADTAQHGVTDYQLRTTLAEFKLKVRGFCMILTCHLIKATYIGTQLKRFCSTKGTITNISLFKVYLPPPWCLGKCQGQD